MENGWGFEDGMIIGFAKEAAAIGKTLMNVSS